jgi:exopolysaccharide biosynthesis polyprenyl glycosylphosphotransferase
LATHGAIDTPAQFPPAQFPAAYGRQGSNRVREDAGRVRSRRGSLVKRVFPIVDALALLIAFAIAQLVFVSPASSPDRIGTVAEWLVFAASLPAWIVVGKLNGLYTRDPERADHSTADEFVAVLRVAVTGLCVFATMAWISGLARPYPPKLILFLGCAASLIPLGRIASRTALRRRETFVQNVLVVGAGKAGQLVAGKLLQHSEYRVNVVGFVDGNPLEAQSDVQGIPILGSAEGLPEMATRLGIERVVLSFSSESDEELLGPVRALQERGVHVDVIPRLFDALGPRVDFHTLAGFPLIGIPPISKSRCSLFVKRAFDIVIAALLLLVLAPLFVYIAVRVKLGSPGRLFYRQERIGRHGKPFRIFKFRTMYNDQCQGHRYGGSSAELEFDRLLSDGALRDQFESLYKLRVDPRVTTFGRVLRGTSLDELPQIVNVLRGEMSLVGPRPIVEAETSRYGEHLHRLVAVRPGMTGYWQVSGRSDVSYAERVRLDLAYIGSWSLGLDVLILAKTVRALISHSGAY